MNRLDANLTQQLHGMLSALPQQVTLKLFTRAGAVNCPGCADASDLLDELAAASGGTVRIETHDVDIDPHVADRYHVRSVPAIAVLGDGETRRDYGIRFLGAPDGYEFATLIEDIRLVGSGEVDLMPATRDVLEHLLTPLHIQVFVTPTCPYCPRAALLAHSLAMASDKVTAEVIDAAEFPVLANEYHVRGVPRTIVNDTVHIEGALPESAFLQRLMPLLEATIH